MGQVRKGAVGGGSQTSHCWDESLKISRRSDHVERVTVGDININSYLASYSYMTTYRNICRYVCMHVSMQTYMSLICRLRGRRNKDTPVTTPVPSCTCLLVSNSILR